MLKKQKGGGFIKCLPVKSLAVLALLFSVIAVSAVFALIKQSYDFNK